MKVEVPTAVVHKWQTSEIAHKTKAPTIESFLSIHNVVYLSAVQAQLRPAPYYYNQLLHHDTLIIS